MTGQERLITYIMDNNCCCDILLKLAQSDTCEEHHPIIRTLAECYSRTGSGNCCGALIAAVAVLYAVKGAREAARCQDELMDWFADSFGGYDCLTLSKEGARFTEQVCPRVILATYLRLRGYTEPDNALSQKTLI
jgi:hypothetical protein